MDNNTNNMNTNNNNTNNMNTNINNAKLDLIIENSDKEFDNLYIRMAKMRDLLENNKNLNKKN
jgi:hypothetical protein